MGPIEKGILQAIEEGVIAGYPLQDVKVTVYDGKHHPVDSKEVAFITAGRRAFEDAVRKANPVILEPVVEMEVTVPNEHMGDITGDLSGEARSDSGYRRAARRSGARQGARAAERSDQLPVAAQVRHRRSRQLRDALRRVRPRPGQVQQRITDAYQPRTADE